MISIASSFGSISQFSSVVGAALAAALAAEVEGAAAEPAGVEGDEWNRDGVEAKERCKPLLLALATIGVAKREVAANGRARQTEREGARRMRAKRLNICPSTRSTAQQMKEGRQRSAVAGGSESSNYIRGSFAPSFSGFEGVNVTDHESDAYTV
jgi:hypothetical protein